MSSSLPLFATRKAPKVSETQVADLIRMLRGRGWCAARSFFPAYSDRQLRAMAEASEGRVISGQRGYRLVEEATVDEANHAAAWLEHQAKKMLTRAQQIRKAMHQRRGAAA